MPNIKTPAQVNEIVTAWRDDVVANQVNRKSAALAEQANAALEALAEQIAHDTEPDLDKWFETHFHQPPVSRDTDFYNALHAAKENLKAQLAA